jgi:ribonuclease E
MLLKVWNKIQTALEDDSTPAPYLIYQEPDLVVRTFRDHYSSDTSQIIVDNSDAYKSLKDFARLVMPRNRNLVKLYKETRPLFSEYKIEEQIESIYERKVPLPSGGSIVIDIGEAMASIDVNSGKTKGGLDLEETALTTNLEAAKEIARQLRLRDLGGLVVIDFIDMYQKKNKAEIEKELKLACKTDKARINLSRISKFGLLEMSRQRISPPVKDGIFDECSHCKGSGHVRSINSIILLVFRKIQELIAKGKVKVISIEISSEIANYLLNSKMDAIVHLKDKYQIDIKFISKPGLIFEDFKFEILETKDEDPEGETKVIDNKYGKELELMESAKVKSEVSTQKVAKSKPEEEVAKTKKRYSKRKSSQRKGQSRSRVRKSYASPRKPDSAKVSASVSGSIDPQASDKKTFHISSEVEQPIIPLPAPFVRSETTTISGSEAEADKSSSIPD